MADAGRVVAGVRTNIGTAPSAGRIPVICYSWAMVASVASSLGCMRTASSGAVHELGSKFNWETYW